MLNEEENKQLSYNCNKTPIICKKCGYEWQTKSKLLMVSCPSCGTKNKIKHGSE